MNAASRPGKIATTIVGIAAIFFSSGSCTPATYEGLPTANSPVPSRATGTPITSEEASTSLPAQKVKIRWLVDSGSLFGSASSSDPSHLPAREKVVADFNASQDEIELVIELVHFDREIMQTLAAYGTAPDIVGPTFAGFFGEWLDLTPYIDSTGFDTGIYEPALIDFYHTEEGQLGLPFQVSPAAVYYVPGMFDAAGLAYPPRAYGDKYTLDGAAVDWSWDTLAEVARRLTIDANGKNATEAGFDAAKIVQIGFVPQWQNHLAYQASYIAGAADIVSGDAPATYESAMPPGWKEANQWMYAGMWGEHPFIANGPLETAPEFGNYNLFGSGKAAMAVTPLWYTCCLDGFRDAGYAFDAGVLPAGMDGQVHGRLDESTFRIWRGTRHPEEAFKALAYLIGPEGVQTLLFGGEGVAADSTWGEGLPAHPDFQQAFIGSLLEKYPFTTAETWNVFLAGLAYPDEPSAGQWQPNWAEAWSRQQSFFDMLQNTPPDRFDFDAEWQKMVDDLNEIYNK